MTLRIGRWRRRVWSLVAMACVLALSYAAPPVRADDPVDEELARWSWATFFDYAGCAIAVASTIPSGGSTILFAAVSCGRALALHFND